MNICYTKKITVKIITFGLLILLTQTQCWGASHEDAVWASKPLYATTIFKAIRQEETSLTPIAFTQLPSGADLLEAVQQNNLERTSELIQQFERAIQNIAVQIICIQSRDRNTPHLGDETIPKSLDIKMRQMVKEEKITWEELYQNIRIWQMVRKNGAVDGALLILNPEFFSYQDDRPFRAAITNGNTNIVRQLLSAGVSPTIVGKNGLTALMVATQKNDIAMVQELLNYAAFHEIDIVNTTNKKGNTALRFAITGGHEAIENMIRQAIEEQREAKFNKLHDLVG